MSNKRKEPQMRADAFASLFGVPKAIRTPDLPARCGCSILFGYGKVAGGIFERCVSRDEFFRETGTTSIDGGKIDYHPKTKERGLTMKLRTVLILAAFAAVLYLTACHKTEMPFETGDEVTSSYSADTTVSEDTTAETVPGFVIEDGALLYYTGDDAEVTIPDSVTAIAQTAFLEATDISRLTIGSNVENIEIFALAPLIGKAEIQISPDNLYYEMIEGVVVRKDGTAIILDAIGTDAGHNADRRMGDVSDVMAKKGYSPKVEDPERFNVEFEGLERMEVGNACIKVDEGLAVESVTVFGKTVDFEDGFLMVTGNRKFQAFEAQGGFVIASISGGWGRTCLIFPEDCITVETPMKNAEDIYSCSVIRFYKEEDRICYERIPEKYDNIQAVGGILEYCVSKDELFRETGTIALDDGKIDYIPQKKETVSDAVDLEHEFALWCNTMRMNPSKITMDEYLQENSRIYSRAE